MQSNDETDSRTSNDTELPDGLLHRGAFDHPVDQLELMETHISWIVLTGPYAYKVKKPLKLPFLDFSTLALRERFVRTELELNRRFAEELYLEVLPIVVDQNGLRVLPEDRLDGAEPIDWCLRMVQFDNHDRLDACVERGEVTEAEAASLAEEIARVHALLPVADPDGDRGTPAAVVEPALENFTELPKDLGSPSSSQAESLKAWTRSRRETLEPIFAERLRDGFIRECHGDLHLSNIVRWQGGHRLFDCIEFDPALRWVDVASDLAFLFMDLLARDERALAWTLLDTWMARTGDYDAGRVLDWYVVYRSVVRAKVAGLQSGQTEGDKRDQHLDRLARHLELAARISQRRRPRLLLMCGLSGSGKSWWAERLVPTLGAVRLRSDVERKRLHGLAPDEDSDSALDDGIYSEEASRRTYTRLADCAQALLDGGVDTIVDATFLDADERARFATLGTRAGARTAIVLCTASEETLRQRVTARAADGKDASEAGLEVLEQQLANVELPDADSAPCPLVQIDASESEQPDLLLARIRAATELDEGRPD